MALKESSVTAVAPASMPVTTKEAAAAFAEALSVEGGKDLAYEFRISRRASPPEFRNLWELAAKLPEDKHFSIVIDADMLGTCIDRIRYIFERDGL